MANHGYVKVRKNLTLNQVKDDTKEIIKRRFQNKLKIEIDKDNTYSPVEGKVISIMCGEEHVHSFWLDSVRILEFRHAQGGQAFAWVERVIQNELAQKYNGKISDDGCDGSWKATPNKYLTYRDYLFGMSRGIAGKEPSFFQKRELERSVKETIEMFGDVFA